MKGVAIIVMGAIMAPMVAFAQVAIDDVHYDAYARDPGREWIEVHNIGTDTVPLADLRVSIDGRDHKIVPLSDVPDLASSEHAVIVQSEALFHVDNPNFSGPVFHSAFTIPNGQDIVALVDIRGATIATFTTERNITKRTKARGVRSRSVATSPKKHRSSRQSPQATSSQSGEVVLQDSDSLRRTPDSATVNVWWLAAACAFAAAATGVILLPWFKTRLQKISWRL